MNIRYDEIGSVFWIGDQMLGAVGGGSLQLFVRAPECIIEQCRELHAFDEVRQPIALEGEDVRSVQAADFKS